MEGLIATFLIAVVIVIALIVFFTFVPIGLWISAMAASAHVSIGSLIGMRFRRINPAALPLKVIPENLPEAIVIAIASNGSSEKVCGQHREKECFVRSGYR